MSNRRKVEKILKFSDNYIRLLVVLSIILYVIEVALGTRDTLHAPAFFLITERLFGVIFTVEYALRWYDDATDSYGWHYPQSALGLIDLISFIPFWLGFFVPLSWLHFIRAFRIFRLLKFFRYSRSLQLVALGFYRAIPALKPLSFSMFIIGLFCTVSIFEVEQDAQPDKFGNLFDSAYFTMVTVATVGYGDMSPVTTLGRIVVMCTFSLGLAIFAGMLGVLGNSFFKVMEEELDPNIDPIEEFIQQKISNMKTKIADKEYGPKYHVQSDGK